MVLKLLSILFLSALSSATLNDVDKQQLVAKNILVNGGFENGKTGWDITNDGTLSIASSGSNLLTGRASATWDTSTADGLLVDTTTVPRGLYGKNGVAFCKFQVPSGTATHTLKVKYGGSDLVSQTITSSTTPAYTFVNFIFPSDTSIQIAIDSTAADEPLIAIDDCFLGDASEVNLSNISQAQFIGSAYIATTANCQPTRADTALGALGDDTDCPGPTVESNPGPGTIQTTDANNLDFTVNNLPPGVYRIDAYIPGYQSSSSNSACFAISDGTTTSPGVCNSGFAEGLWTVTHNFTYTAAGNRTFSIYAASSAGTIGVYNTTALRNTKITIHRFPLSTEQAYRPDAMANSWSGYHDNTCSWARSNTAFGDPTADATCTFTERTNANFGTVTSYLSGSDKLPGIVFTPKRAGRYYVCGNPAINHTGLTTSARLWDGTTTIAEVDATNSATTRMSLPLCGIYVASSTAAKTLSIQVKSSAAGTVAINALSGAASVEWSIFAIDQQLPAPLLVNSVVSAYAGVWSSQSARIDGTVSPSTVSQESGDWIDGDCTRNATGRYTCTIKAGVFSSAPNCFGNVEVDGTTSASVNIISLSSTQLVVETAASAQANWAFYIKCEGPK